MKTIAALTLPAALLLTTFASPTPAVAGTLAFTYGNCAQITAGVSNPHMECNFSWTGANGPVSATFTATNGAITGYTYGSNSVTASGTCAILRGTTVTATITDTVSSASKTVSLTCYHEAP